jgi:hypothetical protein
VLAQFLFLIAPPGRSGSLSVPHVGTDLMRSRSFLHPHVSMPPLINDMNDLAGRFVTNPHPRKQQ